MLFFTCDQSGQKEILLKGDEYRSLIASRRKKIGDRVLCRSFGDEMQYEYIIDEIGKKKAVLVLQKAEKKEILNTKGIHLAWGVCESKTITKTLPFLNELGVQKISFVWCNRSQKNTKIDFEKYTKIIRSSNEQCGRTNTMVFEEVSSTKDFLEMHPNTQIFDFGGQGKKQDIFYKHPVFIGPEGGFSPEEKTLFKKENTYAFSTPLVLRSETAAITVAGMGN